MRPLLIGIILFLGWLIISSWYYSRHIFPVLNPAEETTLTESVADTTETPPEAPALPAVPGDITLYFGFDKTAILDTDALRSSLPEWKKYLEADSDACLLITGHTCDIGTEAYNKDLGTRRAESVQKWLLSNGITDECIRISSMGETQPAVANTGEANRKQNRRAELQINQ